MGLKSFSSSLDSFSKSVNANLVEVQYLIIGGGGSVSDSGPYAGGGGGAGGYRCSVSGESSGGLSQSETPFYAIPGTQYSVTVGSGGSARQRGSDSAFAGIIANGGGRGGLIAKINGLSAFDGGNGGSGGGGSSDGGTNYPGGMPAPTQGHYGGIASGTTGVNSRAGGGGGAGAVGGNASSSAGGNGGAGISSSITGSSITRAGGGGGGGDNASVISNGGTGGGGNGCSASTGPTSGTANTGGGAGGGSVNFNAVSGGSGVVILRSTSVASVTTGSPTYSTSGPWNIYVFNGDGTITF